MTAPAVPDRNEIAAEYLQLLRSLASEMESAMRAIAHNALPDLEESVANQQNMSSRLLELAADISTTAKTSTALGSRPGKGSPERPVDADLIEQVHQANATLQALNRRYATLLEHSSRSVAMMISLYSSFQGQVTYQPSHQGHITEASGPRLNHPTWSCQM